MKRSRSSTFLLLLLSAVLLWGCQPDLEVSLTADGAYAVGDDIAGTAEVTARNTGKGAAQGTEDAGEDGYMIDLVLSEDATVPVAFAVVPTPYTFSEDMLLEGGRISVTSSLAAGSDMAYSNLAGVIPPGTPEVAYLCAVVDPGGKIAESDEANNTFCTEIAVKAGARCVTFEPPALSTQYGTSAGHAPGDQVLVENGITMTVETFYHPGGGSTMNDATITATTATFGVGAQYLWFNNINLEFDFTGLGFTPTEVTFLFIDHGGHENVSINLDPSPPWAGELTAAPSPLGGVTLTTAPPDGQLTAGTIERLRIGGQELGIDQVCAWP